VTRDGLVDAPRDGLGDVPLTSPHLTSPSKNNSSRSMALADTDQDYRHELVSDLARILCSIRPDWTWAATKAAVRADDRPWRTVVLASIRGAAGNDIRHPNGLRYVNPDGVGGTPLPPTVRELRTAVQCSHGAPSGLCALCRMGVE
jgi:hypothetical protein